MLLYLVNQTRNAPQEWAERLSVWLPAHQRGPFQPVVPNEALREAAQAHSDDMLRNNMGGHTGSDGSSPGQRAARFGYEGDVNENAAAGYSVNQQPAGAEPLARARNDSWFSSSLHRANMLTADWTEFGGAFAESFTQSSSGSNWNWRATELFGKYDAGPFLVGVVFNDQNGDSAYNVGEGLGGVPVTVTGPNGTFTTTTMSAGAWYLSVPAGQYFVEASGGRFQGVSRVPIEVGNHNLAVDFVSGVPEAWINFRKHTNSAPTLTPSRTNNLPPVVVGGQAQWGTTVASLLGPSFSDADPISLQGIAVTATAGGSVGTWQYSVDQGTTWRSLGSPTEATARLLAAEDMVRFLPRGTATGTGTLSFRGWDRTAGAAGGVFSTAANGGMTPFSQATAVAEVVVVSSNSAPALLGNGGNGFRPIYEDSPAVSGTLVADLVGTGYQDPDSDTVPGVALTGLTGTESGTWVYSIDAGSSWIEIGAVAADTALLLRPGDQLSFRPDENQVPSFAATFRLWDQSSGRGGTRANLASAAAVGGVSAFSASEQTVSAVVLNTNDAPTLAPDASSLRLRPIAMNSGYYGAFTVISDLLGNAFVDMDPGAEPGIAVIGIGQSGTLLGNIGGGNWGGSVSPGNARLYRATDRIGFMPNGGFTGESSITFRLWDQTQGTTATSSADLSQPQGSTGGSSAFGREVITAKVFVGAAGEAPTANFGAVTMQPSQAAAQSVAISFSEAVTGFDLDDLRLTRDGQSVSLTGAALSGHDRSFVLSGLEAATSVSGRYVLQLPATGTAISDSVGNRLAASALTTFTVVRPNLPPSAIELSNVISSLSEATPTATPIRVADIRVVDDGSGVNMLLLSGANASFFELNGTRLYLKAGVSLDSLTTPTLAVTISATDSSVAGSSSVTTAFQLDVEPIGPRLQVGSSGAISVDGQIVTHRGGGVTRNYRGATIFEAAVVQGRNMLFAEYGDGEVRRVHANPDWSLIGGLDGIGGAFSLPLPRSSRGPNFPVNQPAPPPAADVLVPIEISGRALRVDGLGRLYAGRTPLSGLGGGSEGVGLTAVDGYRPIAVMRENVDSQWRHTLLWQHRIHQDLLEWQFTADWRFSGRSRVPVEDVATLEAAYEIDVDRDGVIG